MCLVLVNASCLCLFPVFALRVLPTFAALVSSRYVFALGFLLLEYLDYVRQSKLVIFDQ